MTGAAVQFGTTEYSSFLNDMEDFAGASFPSSSGLSSILYSSFSSSISSGNSLRLLI